MKSREYFHDDELSCFNYDIYQLIVIQLAPQLHRWGISPNTVTLARVPMALAILLIMLHIAPSPPSLGKTLWCILALLILFVSFVCDDLDGFVARKHNQRTFWGGVLDSFTDIGTYLLLAVGAVYCYGWHTFALLLVPSGLAALIGFAIKAADALEVSAPGPDVTARRAVRGIASLNFLAFLFIILLPLVPAAA